MLKTRVRDDNVGWCAKHGLDCLVLHKNYWRYPNININLLHLCVQHLQTLEKIQLLLILMDFTQTKLYDLFFFPLSLRTSPQ